jgi:hypothetical protein
MKKTILSLALLSLLVLGGQALADIGTIDAVPAATLLVPYFEVDLNSDQGITTLFEINNASATPIIAHVTVWTDLSVPVLDFNVYLTGYDVQPINVRDILNLVLPDTAPPQFGGKPFGEFSIPSTDPAFDEASCDGQLPPGPLPAAFATSLKSVLSGGPSIGNFPLLDGRCGGVPFNDGIARGYITVDAVRTCTLQFPGDPGYFVNGGQGEATNDNVLWGNLYYVDPTNNFAQGETLVHIEADGLNPETSVPGEYTFYGRLVAWSADDNREPLATNFAARYLQNAAFTGGTDYIVWRDSKFIVGGFTCGTLPAPFPLGQEALVIFDEMENPDVVEVPPISPAPPGVTLNPFPWEAQRVTVGGPDLPTPFSAGWMFLDLNTNVTNGNPPEDPDAAQAWVTVVASAEGRFSVGYDAVQLDSATNARHDQVPGPPGP